MGSEETLQLDGHFPREARSTVNWPPSFINTGARQLLEKYRYRVAGGGRGGCFAEIEEPRRGNSRELLCI